MILESIVTTLDQNGGVNIAPMGPHVDRELREIVLKPFKSSTTYTNLQANRGAVVHVVDDVLLVARAAIGQIESPPPIRQHRNNWAVLEDACRWFAVTAREWTDDPMRPSVRCQIVESGSQRDFFGFNRAKHAVLELAILATRIHILPAADIKQEITRLAIAVEKTGGDQERLAFDLLRDYCSKE